MRCIIQLVLFVAVCAVVACANPVDNDEEQALLKLDEVDAGVSLLREETDKADPTCTNCKFKCRTLQCKGKGSGGKSTKKPKTLRDEEMDQSDPVCQTCYSKCESTVCKGGKGSGGKGSGGKATKKPKQ